METLIINGDSEKIFKLHADDGSGMVQDINMAYAYLNLIEDYFLETGYTLVIGGNDDQDHLQIYSSEQLNRVIEKIPDAKTKFEGDQHMVFMLENLAEIVKNLLDKQEDI